MIQTTGLTKRYGEKVAVDAVDLVVEDGSVHGLVGRNGAGKTTLLRMLAGLRTPTSGSVSIESRREELAVLPDTPRFDPWLTGREVVELAASLVGGADRINEVLGGAGLSDAGDRRVGGYSRGMLQRLGIAAALVGSPRLLLADEPASALDPQGRREVLDVIGRMRGEATVLFSSHILADVQEVCDSVSIMEEGRLLFQGSIRDLLIGSATPRYLVRIRPDSPDPRPALMEQSWVSGVEARSDGVLGVSVRSLEDAELHLAGVLASAGSGVISLGPEAVTLEQAFLELTS